MNLLNITMKTYDRYLLGIVISILIIGTVMLYSASSSLSLFETQGRSDMIYLRAHLIRLLSGFIALFVFMILDYRKLKVLAPYLIIGSIILLALTKGLFILKGQSAPARWLYLGPFSIQTSDIARLSLIIYLAYVIDKKREQIKDFYNGFLPPMAIVSILIGLTVIQPDFSTALLLGIIGFLMLFSGGARLPQLAATGAVGLAIGIPVMVMLPYRRDRILSWFNDNVDPELGYQAKQALISLGNGGIFGLGLGNSMEKNLFLPEPHTDFIFAIIGEELGVLGTLILLSLFLFIFQRGIKIAKESTDPFGVHLTIGIILSIILYAFINTAVVTNLVPVTGLPMPFISYGGSGMVVNMASMGILLNISQRKRSVSHGNGWSPWLHG